jgi:hypothetical protein
VLLKDDEVVCGSGPICHATTSERNDAYTEGDHDDGTYDAQN